MKHVSIIVVAICAAIIAICATSSHAKADGGSSGQVSCACAGAVDILGHVECCCAQVGGVIGPNMKCQ